MGGKDANRSRNFCDEMRYLHCHIPGGIHYQRTTNAVLPEANSANVSTQDETIKRSVNNLTKLPPLRSIFERCSRPCGPRFDMRHHVH